MKSKTYKITLVIEAAIAVLIAFCLAFFGPLSLNDMTYGEFDMQVFKLCFTYPAIIVFIALFVVLAVISYKKEHTKKRYATEIVLFAVLLIFVYFLGVFVPRTFRYEGVVMNAAEYTDIMHELKPSECFEGENTDYIEKIGENLSGETVVLLSHKKADSYIHIDVEFGEGEGKIPVDSIAKRAEAYKPKEKVTYKMIKEYIEAKYGFKVHTAYIAEVKRNLGLPMYDAPNAVEELKQPRKHPTPEKVEAIKDALRYFAVI